LSYPYLPALPKTGLEMTIRPLRIEHEVPAAPVLGHGEVFEAPQIVHNGSILEVIHAVNDKFRRARPAERFSETPAEPSSVPALYGENSAEILDELGLSAEA
jgi:crotonobetainyl-CoA:carnitine CoA-transferase CaiB-like acyl-CoA transferase